MAMTAAEFVQLMKAQPLDIQIQIAEGVVAYKLKEVAAEMCAKYNKNGLPRSEWTCEDGPDAMVSKLYELIEEAEPTLHQDIVASWQINWAPILKKVNTRWACKVMGDRAHSTEICQEDSLDGNEEVTTQEDSVAGNEDVTTQEDPLETSDNENPLQTFLNTYKNFEENYLNIECKKNLLANEDVESCVASSTAKYEILKDSKDWNDLDSTSIRRTLKSFMENAVSTRHGGSETAPDNGSSNFSTRKEWLLDSSDWTNKTFKRYVMDQCETAIKDIGTTETKESCFDASHNQYKEMQNSMDIQVWEQHMENKTVKKTMKGLIKQAISDWRVGIEDLGEDEIMDAVAGIY